MDVNNLERFASSIGLDKFKMPTMATLTRMADFDMKVGKHLQNVYASLCLTILAAAAGAFAHMNYHFGGGGTCMGVFLIGLYLHSSRNPNGNFDQTRFLALLALGFLKGASIGGLIQQALYIDTSIVVTALLATAAVFGCFSAAALLGQRRAYLYLGGTLSSVMFYLMVANLGNYMFGFNSQLIHGAQLYVGLGVFCGYVVFDTQMIIEKADRGDRDVVQHAMQLFLDLIAIFVRLLIILMKNAQQNGQQRRRDERRRD